MQIREPTLNEMLADPIVRQLMHRDGVAEADVRGLAFTVGRHLNLSGEAAKRPPEPRILRPLTGA